MKAIAAGVTWNVVARLGAVVLFGILVIDGVVGPRQNSLSVRPVPEGKFLLADGPTPIPQWPLPPPKAIA